MGSNGERQVQAGERAGERTAAARAMAAALAVSLLAAGCTTTTDPLQRPPAGPTGPPTTPPASPPQVGSNPPGDAAPAPAPAPTPPAAGPAATLRMHFVNVGQGDGVVWELPGGGFVVYDCGPPVRTSAENPMVAALRSLGLASGGTIHTLIASHGHLDHIGGCEEILAEYRVLHVYEAWYDGADAPASYERFRGQVQAEGAVMHVAAATDTLEGEVPFRAGDPLALPEAASLAGVRGEVLWPTGLQGDGWADIQESSIAVRLSLGSVDFCFQGDIEERQEATLAASFGGRDCEVYLVGHHGSRHASTAGWLAAMDPEVAVVSFGENSYGHPTSEALCHVQQAGASVYATHRLGTVTVETTGTAPKVAPDGAETEDYCAVGATYWS